MAASSEAAFFFPASPCATRSQMNASHHFRAVALLPLVVFLARRWERISVRYLMRTVLLTGRQKGWARAMKNRSRSYNYGYTYSYTPQTPSFSPTPTAPGRFFTEAEKATLGPLTRALVKQVEDRRRLYVDTLQAAQVASARGLTQAAAQLFEQSEAMIYARPRLGFANPQQIPVCVRRKERREVLLAKGKGGGNHRKARRNQWSDVKC